MAAIDILVANHFASVSAGVEPSFDLQELDIGLLHAGKMAETIFDQVMFPECEIDAEGVAASARALISLLGNLGSFIDALEQFLKSASSRTCDASERKA